MLSMRWVAVAWIIGLPAVAQGVETFSTSIMHPSAVPPNGVVAGSFAGSETRYYFALDAQPGDLLTQISVSGRAGAQKELQLELLDSSARARDSYWVHGSSASEQATRSFAIDAAGRQVLRVVVKGPENGQFCIELGGKAFPTTGGGGGCPAPAGEKTATAPP